MSHTVIAFGDRVPAGDDDDLFVSYVVEGFGGMLCGPYKTRPHAESELWDIAGYEGVKDSKIVTRRALMGLLDPTVSDTLR